MWSTALAEDEILTGISFPVRAPGSGYAIEEFARRKGDFALAGAAVSLSVAGGGVSACAISLFGLGPCAQRAPEAERAVIAGASAEEVGRIATDGLDSVPADLHGSAEYRKHLGGVLVARALTKALQEARG